MVVGVREELEVEERVVEEVKEKVEEVVVEEEEKAVLSEEGAECRVSSFLPFFQQQ